MTAKEFVLSKYPDAYCNHPSRSGVWKIWQGTDAQSRFVRLSEGKSETNAWANAKRKIEQQEKECTHCQEEDPVFGMKYPCHCKQILEQPKQQQQ